MNSLSRRARRAAWLRKNPTTATEVAAWRVAKCATYLTTRKQIRKERYAALRAKKR